MKKDISKIYDYLDAGGNLLFQVVRFVPKTFSQRRPFNNGFAWGLSSGWYRSRPGSVDYYSLNDSNPKKQPHPDAVWLDTQEPCLYRLPELLSGIKKGHDIYVCEGEKDADRLAAWGFITTTSPMGSNKWRSTYTESLKDASSLVIMEDNDEPGRKHSLAVAKAAYQANLQVKILRLPDQNGKPVQDISDWIENGGTQEEFVLLVNECCLWQPNNADRADSGAADTNKTFETLIKQFGEPYYFNEEGFLTTINESFWAALHHAEHIELYEPDEKTFYRYERESGLYRPISEDALKQEISARILKVSRQVVQPALEKMRSNSILNNIIGQLRGIAEKRGCFSNKKARYVHLANGVITFGECKDTNLTGFSNTFFSRNRSPIAFDPSAKCDRFLSELIYPAIDHDDAILIQKYVGQCLLGTNLIQRFLILDGLGGRGKTQLANIVQHIVGQVNVMQLRTNLLNERFETYRFLKKTLLVGVDVPGRFLSERGASNIKALVGGDWMDAERKGGNEEFKLQGNFCVIITANTRLHVKLDGDVTAWRRRLLIVRYEAPPPVKKIPDFADLLVKTEGPGILNWALHGLGLLLMDIESLGDIYLTEAQDGRIDALLAESDSLKHFLKERVTSDDDGDLSKQEIIEAYAEYCPTKGWNAKPITIIQKELEGLMLELFCTSASNSIPRGDTNVKGFRRVCFKKEPQA